MEKYKPSEGYQYKKVNLRAKLATPLPPGGLQEHPNTSDKLAKV
jgi:hypothetical protein